jgi:hypothetical protein
MKDILLCSLTIAYAVAGFVCIIAYYPTIADLYFKKKVSANISTYMLWTFTAIISSLYSLFILEDNLFRIISVLNLVSCSIILFLRIKIKKQSHSQT